MSLFSSRGIKRQIAGLLTAILEVIRAIPEALPFVPLLESVIGILGGTAVTHAALAQSLNKHKLSTLASILAVVIAVAPYIPALLPFIPLLQKLAALLGALGAGSLVTNADRRNKGTLHLV